MYKLSEFIFNDLSVEVSSVVVNKEAECDIIFKKDNVEIALHYIDYMGVERRGDGVLYTKAFEAELLFNSILDLADNYYSEDLEEFEESVGHTEPISDSEKLRHAQLVSFKHQLMPLFMSEDVLNTYIFNMCNVYIQLSDKLESGDSIHNIMRELIDDFSEIGE